MKVKVLFSVLIVLLFSGCARSGKHIPKHAIINPAEGISVPHPVEIEKAGVKTITTFQGLMDPGLWVEVIDSGGVWPFFARTSSGEILGGYVYLVGINYWGDWQLQFVTLHSLEKIERAKILYFNKDAGYCYNLAGIQVEYNPKKFEESKEYQDEIFQEHGTTIKELNSFFLDYLKKKGLNPPNNLTSVNEIKVGNSSEWKYFKEKLSAIMRYNYKMSDGEIRCGWLPLKYFQKEAVQIPGFNGVDRYLKRANVPLFVFPFAGVGLMVIAGASVVGDIASAGIDDNWEGYYARAETMRYKMAPLFRQICLIYKELLKARDEEIKRLKTNIYIQKILNEN